MSTQEARKPGEPAGGNVVWAVLSTAMVAAWLAFIGGWVWALAGVVGIFVHEWGHAFAINKAGLGPSRIHFVPFLGGLATQPKPSPDEMTDVVISLAGPAVGILAFLPFYLLHLMTGNTVWLEGAFFVAIINLLNLFPAPPLDGSKAIGPVLARVHPMLERVAAVLCAAFAVLWGMQSGNFQVGGLIAVAAAPLILGMRIRPPSTPLSDVEAIQAAGLYVGTALVCLFALAAIGAALGGRSPFELLSGVLG